MSGQVARKRSSDMVVYSHSPSPRATASTARSTWKYYPSASQCTRSSVEFGGRALLPGGVVAQAGLGPVPHALLALSVSEPPTVLAVRADQGPRTSRLPRPRPPFPALAPACLRRGGPGQGREERSSTGRATVRGRQESSDRRSVSCEGQRPSAGVPPRVPSMPTPPRNRRASRAAVAAAGLIAMASAPAAFGDEAAPELAVGGIEPISGVQPGNSFALPVTVANKGIGAADKVWVSYAVTRGLDFTEIPPTAFHSRSGPTTRCPRGGSRCARSTRRWSRASSTPPRSLCVSRHGTARSTTGCACRSGMSIPERTRTARRRTSGLPGRPRRPALRLAGLGPGAVPHSFGVARAAGEGAGFGEVGCGFLIAPRVRDRPRKCADGSWDVNSDAPGSSG